MQGGNVITIALEQGQMLEEYRIDSILGKGGFAITYLATDTRLDKQVAIKELLPDGIATRVQGNTVAAQAPSHEEDFRWAVNSFLQEAKVLASFEHPNIVSVLRLFETNGTAYIVMPFVQGKTIKDLILEQGRLPYETVHSIIHALLNGLSTVHEAGVLHRDIKPDNIILTGNNIPILIDFGAARQQVSGKSQNITSIITPGYAPIEQYSTDARYQGAWSDIYAMATVAYHMITGKKPTAASERNDSVRNQSPDPVTPLIDIAPPGYPSHFIEALDQALQMNENQRPQDVTTWQSMLGGPPQNTVVNTTSELTRIIPQVRETKKPRNKNLLAITLISTVILLAGGITALILGPLSNQGDDDKKTINTPNTLNAINIEQVREEANEFLSTFNKGFWSGPDAWYLTDNRVTDSFGVSMLRKLKENKGLTCPIRDKSLPSGAIASAGDIVEKDGKAIVDLDGLNGSTMKLVMVQQDGKWLVDSRLGGSYQLNANSDVTPRIDEKEFLLTARKRKNNLVSIQYEDLVILNGTLIKEPIVTKSGFGRPQLFLRLNNQHLDVVISPEKANLLGIEFNKYISQIPIFYPNGVSSNFHSMNSWVGKKVQLKGRASKHETLTKKTPLGFFVNDIHQQLGVKPSQLTGNWLFPDSDKRLLMQADLKKLNQQKLWRARNEIYARRGLIFTSAKGRELTKSLGSAYRPISTNEKEIREKMNGYEQANINTIIQLEKKKPAFPLSAPTLKPVSMKSKIHPLISNTPSKAYVGKKGRNDALYCIQWLPNNMIRGSIFQYDLGREAHIYGTNHQDGIIEIEIWHDGELFSTARMTKSVTAQKVTWSGLTKDSSPKLMQFSRDLKRPSSDPFTSQYLGKVGTSMVDITLNWHSDGTVLGNYRSRATGKTYQLAGDNTAKGFLYLDEFTLDNLSARILLVKKVKDGKVNWQGKLFNIDGRVKDITFTKK